MEDNTTLHGRADTLVSLFERMHALSRSPAFSRLIQLNLGISHIRALRHIADAEAVTMGDLAAQLAMTPPSVTALVRRLEAIGLVERTRAPSDSRVWLLGLTEEGRTLGAQIHAQRRQMMAQLLETLDEGDQQTLLSLMGHAIATAETMADINVEK